MVKNLTLLGVSLVFETFWPRVSGVAAGVNLKSGGEQGFAALVADMHDWMRGNVVPSGLLESEEWVDRTEISKKRVVLPRRGTCACSASSFVRESMEGPFRHWTWMRCFSTNCEPTALTRWRDAHCAYYH